MPRFKARPSPAVPLALANGSGTGTGTSSEIQVRTGKLYLVKTGCPPVVRESPSLHYLALPTCFGPHNMGPYIPRSSSQ